ncbi:MAG: calcium/sodium antiporter [Caldilineaceae bacterium]|nr:calcium/sodium antiporter [Caldilineaceae bacterium]
MNPLLLNILLFLVGFVLLTGGADFLVRGASRLAVRLNVPLVVIGLTVVAFGTSLPELVVSLIANLQGGSRAELAIGNVVGSNIANLALILGVVAVLRPLMVERQVLQREYPLMIGISLVFTWMAWDGQIAQWEGVLLFLGLLGFVYWSYAASRSLAEEKESEALEYIGGEAADSSTQAEGLDDQEEVEVGSADTLAQSQERIARAARNPLLPAAISGLFRSLLLRDIGMVVLGISVLVLGADWLVDSATFIATYFGVSELVIGLSLVALGTSLPELAASVVAILYRRGDIALGNLVGSNLFNMMAVVGITASVRPLPAPLSMRCVDFPVMLVVAVLPFLLVLPSPHIANRWKGALMLAIYVGYIIGIYVISEGNGVC